MSLSRLCGATVYAVLSIYLLTQISHSWETIHYLIFYCLLSFAYFFWLRKRTLGMTLAIVILFSLLVSLIRLSDQMIAYFFSFNVQKIYYFVFFIAFIYGSFYFLIRQTFLKKSPEPTPQVASRWINLFRYLWQEKPFLILIFLFGLGVRVLFAVQLTLHLPPGVMGGPDSAYHDDALSLAQTGNILDPKLSFLSQKGSVVLFYAMIYKLFGNNLLIAHLLNALLGGICVLLTYSIAKFVFDETTAKIAAILTAGYGFLIQYGGYIGSEAVGLFTIELFLWPLFMAEGGNTFPSRAGSVADALSGKYLPPSQLRAQESIPPLLSKTMISYALIFFSGMSLTLTMMARPEYYYGLPFIFAWICYFLRKTKIKILYFALGFMIIALPWMVRNFLTFGDFTLSSVVSTGEGTQQSLTYQTWFYEFKKFGEAGIPVNTFGQMMGQFFHHPLLILQIIWPHLVGQAAKFWDYDIFFTPAFIFLQPKSSAYNLVLCFYLYCFMIAGIYFAFKKPCHPKHPCHPERQRGASLLLLFLILFKMISYVLTTSATMYEPTDGTFSPNFKDWYRFTIVPLTHIFMGSGIASVWRYVPFARWQRS